MMNSKTPRYPAGGVRRAVSCFSYSVRNFVVAAWGAFTCVAVLGASAASADTTYNYVGSPYTGGNHAALGTNMTASVTFNFDTTGFSGTFGNLNNHTAPVIALQITAGPFTATYPGGIFTWFLTLDAGEITSWLIRANGSGPFGFNGPYPFNYSDYISSPGLPGPVGVDQFEQVHSIRDGDPPNVTGLTSAFGQWFIVPAPAMGAGLPALLALASLGWLGWRRRRQ
jgi:hypothetical protein